MRPYTSQEIAGMDLYRIDSEIMAERLRDMGYPICRMWRDDNGDSRYLIADYDGFIGSLMRRLSNPKSRRGKDS